MKMKWVTSFIMCLFLSAGTKAQTWNVDTWLPPYNYENPSESVVYTPVKTATDKWNLCIAYPHLKDPYWLSVNYGMMTEAKRLGLQFTLFDAGGYLHTDRQKRQISNCLPQGADALILGSVSFSQMNEFIRKISHEMPVIATVNDISSSQLSAKVGVSWVDMGRITAEYLADLNPKGMTKKKIALFPGPKGPEWVDFVLKGFEVGLQDAALEVVVVKQGDTGKEIQRTLIEEALEKFNDIDYLVGTAVTAEAAVSVLKKRAYNKKIQIVSIYLTHGVYRGIKRGTILAAPTDHPVLQGKMSVELAVRVLQNDVPYRHIGPSIDMIHSGNINTFDVSNSLPPVKFIPVYSN